MRYQKRDGDEVKALIDELTRGGSCEAEEAAIALGHLGDARGLGPLIEALRDGTHINVAQAAEDALVLFGEPAVPALIEALSHHDEGVRVGAALVLARLPDERAREPLARASATQASRVARWAALALGQLADPRALPPLTKLLHDENAIVQELAADGLRRIEAGDG